MIGTKLSDQKNSRHADRFKSTNQRLASDWAVEECQALIDLRHKHRTREENTHKLV